MNDADLLAAQFAETKALFRDKIGGSGETLAQRLKSRGHKLPRTVRKSAAKLAAAEPMLAHPKLRLTQDMHALGKALSEVDSHLKSISISDQRKGWWLGVLGGMAFNLLLFGTFLVVIYVWRNPG
ncbi:MAG: hypothetical protein AAGA05_05655 [Pseudomonadota bacterium]